MKWGPLRKKDERGKVLSAISILGSGGFDYRDYKAVFVKRTEKADFYIVKYGVRTIYERGWDDEWFDVYNWNILVVVHEKPDGKYIQIDQEEFLTYEEAKAAMEKFMNEYPDKYYSFEEEEEIETPEWAKPIIYQALTEAAENPDKAKEIKAKLSGTALCTYPKLLRKTYEQIDMITQQ